MKVGDLIQRRGCQEWKDLWGIGMIVGHCAELECEAGVHMHAHWILHFPDRRGKQASDAGVTAFEFRHTRVSEGLDKDNLKWLVVE